jgi:membrane-associated phospholipid phosphatase
VTAASSTASGPGDKVTVVGAHPASATSTNWVREDRRRHYSAATRLVVTLLGWSCVVALGFAVSAPPPASAERSVARGLTSLPDAVTPVLEVVMQAGTRAAILVLVVLLAAARRWRASAAALLAGIATWMAMHQMKVLIERPRPTAALLDHVPKDSAGGWAYPSGHAAIAAALATIVVLMGTERRSLRWVAAAVAALTGLARVHLGVHWPLDVAAGAVVGVLAGWVTTALLQARPARR